MYKKCERCPYYLGTNLRPKGWNGKKTKRGYKCLGCKRHIMTQGKDWFVSDSQIEMVDALLKERLSLQEICRVVKISISWLMGYKKSIQNPA